MMITMTYNAEWSPTGFIARLKLDSSHSPKQESESAVVAWGAHGEPFVHVYCEQDGTIADNGELTDASQLPHFLGIDGSLYQGAPIAAAHGWTVEITHPSRKTETRPVAAWLQQGPEAAPMVPGSGKFEGTIVYVGQEYAEPAYKFGKKLSPPT